MAQDQETHFNSSLAGDDDDYDLAFQLSSRYQPPARTSTPARAALCFKLKIPKFEGIEEDDLGRPPTDVLRTCSECGKQFTSGKALGGHKRACLQKKTPKPTIKKVVNNSMQLDDQDHHTSAPTSNGLSLSCYVCKQFFRSLKSLYGHMRKHPEREWRGIQPPQATNSSTISNTDDDDRQDYDSSSAAAAGSTVDLVEKLKGWSVKARRGQRVSDDPVSTSFSDDETEAMQQAVNDLLMLAEYRSNDCLGKKRGFDQASSVGSGYGVLKITERRSDVQDGKRTDTLRNFVEQGKWKTELEAQDTNKCNNSQDTWVMNEHEDDSEMEISRKMMKQLKKKKRRLTELDDIETANEDPISTQSSYYCPICNKDFIKPQALGGHVASHNKNKNVNTLKDSSASDAVSASEDGNRNTNITNEAVENGDHERQVASEETGELSRIAAAAADEHRCNKCSKTFPTGQALGGHKRCHWTGPAEAFSSTSQVTSSAGEVTQTARRVVLDIDLNDTPTEYFQVFGGEAAVAAAS